MIGAVSLLLVLLALPLGIAWLVAWPLLGLWSWLLASPKRAHLARYNVVVLALPLLIGVVVAVGAIWPSEGLLMGEWACHCEPGTPGSLHLCVAHPESSLPLLPVAAFLLVWLGWRPAQVVATVFRSLSRASRLLREAKRGQPDGPVRLVDLGAPNAFTVGLLRPVVVADASWWSALAPDERKIVAEHERAHALCMDPLSYTTAQLFAGLVPQWPAKRLVAAWLLWAERRADESAAQAIGDRTRVAEFLLGEARVDRTLSLIPSFRGGILEARIAGVLEAPSRAHRLSSDIGVGLPLSGAIALLLLSLFGYQIHALLEALLQRLAP